MGEDVLAGNAAELGGADAGEGHRHEEQDDVGLTDNLAEFDDLRPIRGFAYVGEVRGLVANLSGQDITGF